MGFKKFLSEAKNAKKESVSDVKTIIDALKKKGYTVSDVEDKQFKVSSEDKIEKSDMEDALHDIDLPADQYELVPYRGEKGVWLVIMTPNEELKEGFKETEMVAKDLKKAGFGVKDIRRNYFRVFLNARKVTIPEVKKVLDKEGYEKSQVSLKDEGGNYIVVMVHGPK